jgi:hypothetical protein
MVVWRHGSFLFFLHIKRPGKNPARLKVTTKSKPAYEKDKLRAISY